MCFSLATYRKKVVLNKNHQKTKRDEGRLCCCHLLPFVAFLLGVHGQNPPDGLDSNAGYGNVMLCAVSENNTDSMLLGWY